MWSSRSFFSTVIFLLIGCVAVGEGASPSTTLTWPTLQRRVQGDLFISGVATADDSGVAFIEVVLQNSDTKLYWNGIDEWQEKWIRYPVEIAGSPTTTEWSERIPASKLTNGNYFTRAWARATDGSGDPVGDAQQTFLWEDRPQQVLDLQVESETDSSVTISWTADSDDRLKSFDFFQDGSFVGSSPDILTSTWTFGNLTSSTSFLFGVTAVGDPDLYIYSDRHFSPRATVSAATRTSPVTPMPILPMPILPPPPPPPVSNGPSPSTTLLVPEFEQIVQGDLIVSGEATAPSGVAYIELVLRNTDTKLYWNGESSAWQTQFIRYPVSVTGGGTTTGWAEVIPASKLLQGNYFARAWSRAVNGDGDPEGDAQQTFSWKDRPQRVSNLMLDKVDTTSATVTWDADLDDRLKSYDFFIDGEYQTFSPDVRRTSFTFDKLSPGTSYLLGVTALGDPDEYNFTAQHFSPRETLQVTTDQAPVVVTPMPMGVAATSAPVTSIAPVVPSSPMPVPFPDTPVPVTPMPFPASPMPFPEPDTPGPVSRTPMPNTSMPNTPMPKTLSPTLSNTPAPTIPVPDATPAPVVNIGVSPSTTLTLPNFQEIVQGDLLLSGMATADISGVDNVEVVLQNTDTELYYNGGLETWQEQWIRYPVRVDGQQEVNPDAATVVVSWSEVISASQLVQGNYFVRAWTRAVSGNGDPQGNAKQTFAWVDRPQQVAELQVTRTTPTSVSVSWVADNDDRLQSFDFFVNNVYLRSSTAITSTTFTFEGLSPDTSYYLGVTALGNPDFYRYTNQHFSPRANVEATTEILPPVIEVTPSPVPPVIEQPEVVIWREDFDTLDPTRWKVEHSTYGDGNNEIQCYRPRNVSVVNGKLVLRAVLETYTCPNGSTRDATSGMVRSLGNLKVAPGQAIEFRVKLTPADSENQGGLWPAVWTSGLVDGKWPLNGEIDWLEVMTARNPLRSVYTIWYQKPDGSDGKTGKEVLGDKKFSDTWHTVRFHYGIGVLTWYLDGTQVHEVTDAPTVQGWPRPFDVISSEIKINLALGGSPGPLDERALGEAGATFEVDYIKVVELSLDGAKNPKELSTPDSGQPKTALDDTSPNVTPASLTSGSSFLSNQRTHIKLYAWSLVSLFLTSVMLV